MRTLSHRVLSRWRLRHDPVRVIRPFSQGRCAAKIDEILEGLDAGVIERSKDIQVRLEAHPLPMDWEFVAFSGDKEYAVSVRALLDDDNPEKRLVSNADLLISCSCPYWQWQGPEYHASQKGYLFWRPRGTASVPDIRDPGRQNFVCKHAYKVLETMRNYVIQ